MKAGRKRTFDKDVALDKAMRVFWRIGYSGTSIATLTSELGINTPSLYAAFGNKEQLFKAVLNHYLTQYSAVHYAHLTAASGASLQERLHACFDGLIELFTDDNTPRGCLLVKSTDESDSAAFPEEITQFIKASGAEVKQVLMTLIDAEVSQENMPKNKTAAVLADYILSISYGLAVQAKAGQSEKSLKLVMDHALSTLPGCH